MSCTKPRCVGRGRQGRSRSACRAILVAAVFLASSCDDATGPPPASEVRITVATTQGIAYADYEWTLNGSLRGFVGGHCESMCDWTEGEMLGHVTGDRVRQLAAGFRDPDFLRRSGGDYGVQCCDQHYYVITYTDSEGTVTVRGSSGALPPEVKEPVDALLESFYYARGGNLTF
jgi:hypothetical protein